MVLPRFKYGAEWSGNPLSFLLSFPLESLSTLQNLQKSHPPPPPSKLEYKNKYFSQEKTRRIAANFNTAENE